MTSTYKTILTLSLAITLMMSACTPDHEEVTEPPVEPQTQKTERPPLPNAYTSNTSALLGQLYGSNGSGGANSTTPQALKTQLKEMRDLEVKAPIPTSWRQVINQLKRLHRAKVGNWSYQARAHAEPKRRDETISVTLTLWGKRDAVNATLLKALKALKPLKDSSAIPSAWSEGYELNIVQGPEQLYVERSAELASDDPQNPTTLSTFKVIKSVAYPASGEPSVDCRRINPLPASLGSGLPKWSVPHLRSHGGRRFVAWYEEHEPNKSTRQVTWLYKGGAGHDRSIAWWTKQLKKRKAKAEVRDAMLEVGIEQTWELKTRGAAHPLKIHWWPERRLVLRGCVIKGPVLNLSVSTTL